MLVAWLSEGAILMELVSKFREMLTEAATDDEVVKRVLIRRPEGGRWRRSEGERY